jgi:hypothetical protein
MAEIPCRFVASESKGALNLASGHAFLGFAEKKGSKEPFIEWQMRVIEDRSDRHAELVIALLAVEELLFGVKLYHGHLAARTFRASGPAKPDKQLAALFIGREHGVYIN